MLLITSTDSETFTHNTLWTTANRHINYAVLHPHGAFYDYLTAILLSGLALEAYLNFIGKQLNPIIWEKKHVHSPSLLQKSRTVLSLCALPLISEANEPCATIMRLDTLRDKMVHGKTMSLMQECHAGDNNNQDHARYDSTQLKINRNTALTALQNTEKFIEFVHGPAAKVLKNPRVNSARLSLNTGYRSHSTGVIP